jgi:UPF0716 protein FxsA
MTIFLVVGTGVIGVYLARRQGFAALVRIRERLSRGEVIVVEMFDAVLLLVAGIMLLIPGIVTDILGLTLLIAPLRRWLILLVSKLVKSSSYTMASTVDVDEARSSAGTIIVDVDVDSEYEEPSKLPPKE